MRCASFLLSSDSAFLETDPFVCAPPPISNLGRMHWSWEQCENSSHKYFTNVLPARQRTTPHCLCQSLYCGALACTHGNDRSCTAKPRLSRSRPLERLRSQECLNVHVLVVESFCPSASRAIWFQTKAGKVFVHAFLLELLACCESLLRCLTLRLRLLERRILGASNRPSRIFVFLGSLKSLLVFCAPGLWRRLAHVLGKRWCCRRKAKCTKADQLRSISAAHRRSREALRTNEKGEHAVVRESEMAVRDSERRRWSLIYLSSWVSVSESLASRLARMREISLTFRRRRKCHSRTRQNSKKGDVVVIIFRNVDDGVPHLRCRDFGVFATC